MMRSEVKNRLILIRYDATAGVGRHHLFVPGSTQNDYRAYLRRVPIGWFTHPNVRFEV